VFVVCGVGSGLFDELITSWEILPIVFLCRIVCDIGTPRYRRPSPQLCCIATKYSNITITYRTSKCSLRRLPAPRLCRFSVLWVLLWGRFPNTLLLVQGKHVLTGIPEKCDNIVCFLVNFKQFWRKISDRILYFLCYTLWNEASVIIECLSYDIISQVCPARKKFVAFVRTQPQSFKAWIRLCVFRGRVRCKWIKCWWLYVKYNCIYQRPMIGEVRYIWHSIYIDVSYKG
jgi:hypothetical protein